MKIVSWSALDAGAWDSAAEQCSEAWLFHRYDWVDIETRYYAAMGHSFAVVGSDQSVVALCPLYQRHIGRGAWIESVLDSGYHRHAGLVVRDDIQGAERKAAISAGMRHLLDLAKQLDSDRIHLSCQNLAPAHVETGLRELPYWVVDYGFSLGINWGPQGDFPIPGMASVCSDQIIRLQATEDELFQRLDSNCRKAIRKANSNGFAMVPARENAVSDYYAIANISAQRTGEQLRSLEVYQTIWDRFAGSGKAQILFVNKGSEQAAALFLLIDKAGMYFFGGISKPEYLPMRVNNWMHWEGMRWGRSRGVKNYRLGPIFPELPEDCPANRVSRFKAEFGAVHRPLMHGSLYLHPERYQQDAQLALRWRCGQPEQPSAEQVRLGLLPRILNRLWPRRKLNQSA